MLGLPDDPNAVRVASVRSLVVVYEQAVSPALRATLDAFRRLFDALPKSLQRSLRAESGYGRQALALRPPRWHATPTRPSGSPRSPHTSVNPRLIPVTLEHAPRDRRGLPVPHVASWSSEHWHAARFDPFVEHVALFTAGRQGRGRPVFDVVNEPRQRRAVLGHRCQVCDVLLPRNPSVGWLPLSALEHGTALLKNGAPVTSKPLCCKECARFTADHCCVLSRSAERRVLLVKSWTPILQYIDPSTGPALHADRFDAGDDPEARARLGRIASRQNPRGIVGIVKIALNAVEVV